MRKPLGAAAKQKRMAGDLPGLHSRRRHSRGHAGWQHPHRSRPHEGHLQRRLTNTTWNVGKGCRDGQATWCLSPLRLQRQETTLNQSQVEQNPSDKMRGTERRRPVGGGGPKTSFKQNKMGYCQARPKLAYTGTRFCLIRTTSLAEGPMNFLPPPTVGYIR